MANSSLPNMSLNQDTEVCFFLRYSAWRQTYLTDDILWNLVAVVSVNSITSILTIVLNALVIEAVRTRKRIRSNTNILLACLAVTDVVVGALVQPLYIAMELRHILGIGPFCKFDIALFIVMSFGGSLSFFHLLLVSLERYVAIKYPLRYKEIVTRRRVKNGILIAWVVSLIILSWDTVIAFRINKDQVNWLTYPDTVFFVLMLAVILAIGYMNVTNYLEAGRLERRMQAEIPQDQAKNFREGNKAAKTVSIILSALIFSYLPLIIVNGFGNALSNLVEKRVLYVLSSWSGTFIFLSSFLNPLIYCWRVKKLRRAFLEMLHLRDVQNNAVEEMEMNCRHPEVEREPRISYWHLRTMTKWKEPGLIYIPAMNTRRLSPIKEVDEMLHLTNLQRDEKVGLSCRNPELQQLTIPSRASTPTSEEAPVLIIRPDMSCCRLSPIKEVDKVRGGEALYLV